MRKGILNRILAGFLVFAMTFLSVDAGAFTALAAEFAKTDVIVNEEQQEIPQRGGTGYIDIGYEAPSIKNDDYEISIDKVSSIPENYDSRDKGYVTAIRNQSSWGTCWAFAAVAAMESYALSHGLVDEPEDIDLSEYALAYFTFCDDTYKDVTGDETICSDTTKYGFSSGGNDEYVFKTLSKWTGIYKDDNTSYEESLSNGYVTPYEPNEEDLQYVLTGQYYINMDDTDVIKAAIIENGAVTASYYSHSDYASNMDTYNYNYEYSGTNHAIAIVGWDDNKDKTLFTMTDSDGVEHTPKNNGAWLVKNSWGTYWGEDGYIWISYEDLGLLSGDAVVYEIAPKDVYDNIYQYDGATVFLASLYLKRVASVYTITGDVNQYIEAVSFALAGSVNMQYTIDVYKNTEENLLDAGELVATKTGKTTLAGYYTVALDEPIKAQPGETYTIRITFDDVAKVLVGYNNFGMGNPVAGTTSTSSKAGECYYYNGTKYIDLYEAYGGYLDNICVKMFTSDESEECRVPQITDVELTEADKVTVNWQKADNAIAYDLWTGTSSTDSNPTITRFTTNSAIVDVTLGENYYFKVRAVYEDELVSEYSVFEVFEASLPSMTINGEYANEAVNLSWDEISYADKYVIYRAEGNGEKVVLTEITDSSVITYTDADVESGIIYYYSITCVVGDVESVATSTTKVIIDVPMPTSFEANSNYYGKLLLSWDALGDKVDGYEIEFGDDGELIMAVELTDGNISSYEINTVGLETEGDYYVSITTYVDLDDGSRVYAGTAFWSIGSLKEPALDARVSWTIGLYGAINVYIECADVDSIYIMKDTDLNSCYMIDLENGVGLFDWLYVSNEPYNLYITNTDSTSGLQEEPFTVGVAYEEPVLDKVEDVKLTTAGETVELHANITNPMENFKYQYQWYVSDTADGAATAIEGATSSTYEANVGSIEKKYYYCIVTCSYKGDKTFNTCNSTGGRTCVMGELYSANLKVEDVAEYIYTGVAITPDIVITDLDENKTLVKGTDYTLSYENNVNAGKATIIITFAGPYSGVAKAYFTINPAGVDNLTISDVIDKTYTGAEITQDFVIKNGTVLLVDGIDYDVTYTDNVNVGTATATITFKGNYTGTKEYTFAINAKSGADLGFSALAEQTYIGSAITPELEIYDEDYVLIKGVDYTLEYTNNINAGEASIIVTFKGNYSGTETVSFKINPKSGIDCTFSEVYDSVYMCVEIVQDITIKDGNKLLTEDVDYTISYKDNINAGTATMIVTFKGNYTGEKEFTFEIAKMDGSDCSLMPLSNYSYTGKAITPEVTLQNNGFELVEGTDYTVAYSNNVNAGTATITLTFKGNYTGTREVNFEINPVNALSVMVESIAKKNYTGSEITLSGNDVVLTYKDFTLVEGTDYEFSSYENNKNAGFAKVVITFKGNYKGTKTESFYINAKDGAECTVADIADQIYTGDVITPEIIVKDGAVVLVNGVDYELSYVSNINIGTATVYIKFKGNYTGTVTKTFEITAKSNESVTIEDIEDVVFTGEEIEPEVVLNDNGLLLTEGTDYTLEYTNNINVGTAIITISFKGNYVGTKEVAFEILKADSSNLTVDDIEDKTYTGDAITLEGDEIIIRYGDIVLVEGVDYDITDIYSENINAGTASLTIATKGNYEGEVIVEFTIIPKSGTGCEVSDIDEQTYNGEAIKPVVVVKDGEKVLVEGTDYTVLYNNNINATESAIITIVYKGNYSGSSALTFKILPLEIDFEDFELGVIEDETYTGYEIVPTVEFTYEDILFTNIGKNANIIIEFAEHTDNINVGEVPFTVTLTGNYAGSLEGVFHIIPMNVEKSTTISISPIEDYMYTGEEITPSLIIKNGAITLREGEDADYTISYKNNIEVGNSATVTITFRGNYEGEIVKTFAIVDPIPDEITSDDVTVSEDTGYISEITVGTTVQSFMNCLNEKEYVAIIKDGKAVENSALIGTGMLAQIMDGNEVVKSYTIIVTGDTNGDGKISITDMIAVKSHILKKELLTGANEKAGDVAGKSTGGDGKVTITDFIKIKAHILKKETITGITAN